MNVLYLTTEWPTEEHPTDVPFLVQYAQALQKHGVTVNVFHFQGKGKPLNYIKAWREVRRQPSWKKTDILHAQWGQGAFPGLFSRKPLIITYHGSDLQGIVDKHGVYGLRGKILVSLNRLIAHFADHCIVVSERLRQFLPPNIAPVDVIPMGIDLAVFKQMNKSACREALGLEQDKQYILFVSNPERPEKRYALAEQAVRLAVENNKLENTQLLVVSGEPYEKIPLYLNAGDLLLLTSSHEGSPVILKEALACNLPIVSVDVGDAKEKLSEIEGCYVCQTDTVEEIAENIGRALGNPIRIKGREAVSDLNWDVIAQKTIAIYANSLHDA